MKKLGAISILTTMLLGLGAWAGSQIIDSKGRLSKLEAYDMTTRELLKEMRTDIKVILRRTR